jgi:thiol-disulfide isomerase/thioredoxin
MKYINLLLFFLIITSCKLLAQTPLTEAPDFSVKTTESETIHLFPLLDNNKIVVIDFFSTSCGPCQTFAYDFELAYQNFGSNEGNAFFVGINYNSDNQGVRIFDSTFNITLPSASGIEGGGNAVYDAYQISAYPTVIVITPDRQIVEQFIWEPTEENITNAVVEAGGLLVGNHELSADNIEIYPNPVRHEISIQLSPDFKSEIHFRLNDLNGKQIISGLIPENRNSIFKLPVSEIRNGLYLLRLESENQIFTQKIFINHD